MFSFEERRVFEGCIARWDVAWAESGEQRYRRELAGVRRRRDGGYDMRFASSRFVAAYEAGEHRDYGLIRLA